MLINISWILCKTNHKKLFISQTCSHRCLKPLSYRYTKLFSRKDIRCGLYYISAFTPLRFVWCEPEQQLLAFPRLISGLWASHPRSSAVAISQPSQSTVLTSGVLHEIGPLLLRRRTFNTDSPWLCHSYKFNAWNTQGTQAKLTAPPTSRAPSYMIGTCGLDRACVCVW